MKKVQRIIVLVSNKGTGTNLQAIINGVNNGKLNAKIIAVISDEKDAYALYRARKYNIFNKTISKGVDLSPILNKLSPDFICLAGWKQIISNEVINAFSNKILNLHPGLIPDKINGYVPNPDGTKGIWNRGKFTKKAVQNFLDSKSTYAGSSVSFLTKEFDYGPVLGRCFEKIKKNDNIDALYNRLKIKENRLYIRVLARLCKNNLKTVLITDGGGRGAALVDKYGQSMKVGRILVVPGNDLMWLNTDKEVITFPNLKTTSVKEIVKICKKEKVDLVDVAQDNAVQIGLVDKLKNNGIMVIGPTRSAGRLEWDKTWARNFMKKNKIPSPVFHKFNNENNGIEFAKKNINKRWFIKASGLAEGKGAIPATNVMETINAIKEMKNFGESGKTYLLEEWLEGEEFSAFALCDGKNFKIVGYAQDHKRVDDGDKGPNTGGMGCVSNPKVINKNIKKQVETIFKKVIHGMQKEKNPYSGVLYLGGMVIKKAGLPADRQVYVIEFNARWGDPEAEVIVPAIKNDFMEIANAITYGKLNSLNLIIDKKVRVAVAATAKGYPANYIKAKGKKIFGLERIINSEIGIYGAGIKKNNGNYLVNGGRLFYLTAQGKNILEAREKVYKAMSLIKIQGNNLHFRLDIGLRVSRRLRS